jgi:hypothetical protein
MMTLAQAPGSVFDLLKKLQAEKIGQGHEFADHPDFDDNEMQEDPRAQYQLMLKKKRRTAMLKQMLFGGDPDLSRLATIREK